MLVATRAPCGPASAAEKPWNNLTEGVQARCRGLGLTAVSYLLMVDAKTGARIMRFDG